MRKSTRWCLIFPAWRLRWSKRWTPAVLHARPPARKSPDDARRCRRGRRSLSSTRTSKPLRSATACCSSIPAAPRSPKTEAPATPYTTRGRSRSRASKGNDPRATLVNGKTRGEAERRRGRNPGSARIPPPRGPAPALRHPTSIHRVRRVGRRRRRTVAHAR